MPPFDQTLKRDILGDRIEQCAQERGMATRIESEEKGDEPFKRWF
jgi:hypothetical protein